MRKIKLVSMGLSLFAGALDFADLSLRQAMCYYRSYEQSTNSGIAKAGGICTTEYIALRYFIEIALVMIFVYFGSLKLLPKIYKIFITKQKKKSK